MVDVVGNENLSVNFHFGLGCWIDSFDKDGNPSVFISPGFYGYYPVIDIEREYLAVLFVHTQNNVDEMCSEIKSLIQEAIDGEQQEDD